MKEKDWRLMAEDALAGKSIVKFPNVTVIDDDTGSKTCISLEAEVLSEYPHYWRFNFKTGSGSPVIRCLSHMEVCTALLYGGTVSLPTARARRQV